MKKYTDGITTIEAIQWDFTPETLDKLRALTPGHWYVNGPVEGETRLYIDSVDHKITRMCENGDYVRTEEDGGLYPIPKKIFETAMVEVK